MSVRTGMEALNEFDSKKELAFDMTAAVFSAEFLCSSLAL
jgi:hypothetical protein